MASESWPKVIVAAVATPLAVLLLGGLCIPVIIDKSNRLEALRNARLRRAVDIGDRNTDFSSRLTVIKTRMLKFNEQNVNLNLSQSELRDAQKKFLKEFMDDHLELDRASWWWYWDLEREGEIFGLLSPEDLTALRARSGPLFEYGKNLAESVAAIDRVWTFLSSSKYSISNSSQKQLKVLESEMDTKLNQLSDPRTQLIKRLSASFAQSQYTPPR